MVVARKKNAHRNKITAMAKRRLRTKAEEERQCVTCTLRGPRCSRKAKLYGVCTQHFARFKVDNLPDQARFVRNCVAELNTHLRTDPISIVREYLVLSENEIIDILEHYLTLNNWATPRVHFADIVSALFDFLAHECQTFLNDNPSLKTIVLNKGREILSAKAIPPARRKEMKQYLHEIEGCPVLF
jgi:hypothetical protein